MMIEIISTPEFDKEYKRLKKKYRSWPDVIWQICNNN